MKQRNFLLNLIMDKKFILIFLFILTNLFFLIHNGIYLDDWYNQLIGPAAYLQHNLECGRPWFGYTVIPVFPLPDIFTNYLIYLHRVIIFLSYLFSGLLFYTLLKKIAEINLYERFVLTLFFMFLPYFESRIFVSMWLYPFCYFIFYLALYLAVFRKKIILRILSLLLFAFSFLVQSFIFFYALTFIFFIYEEKDRFLEALKTKTKLKKCTFCLLNLIKRHLDYFLLPIVIWTLQRVFFHPYGDYAQYNVITWKSLLLSPLFLFKTAFYTIVDLPYAMIAYIFKSNLFLLIFLSGLCSLLAYILYTTYKMNNLEVSSNGKKNIYFLLFSFIVFFLAVFPYAVVGKEAPSLFYWSNRNQLLMPLSISIFIYFSIDLLFRKFFKKQGALISSIFFALFITLLINYSIISWSEYNINWYKQLSIVENFKKDELLKDENIFLVNDKTYELNEIKQKERSIIFYEYLGLLSTAFPGTLKFIEKEEQFHRLLANKPLLTDYYLMGGIHYINSNYNLEKFVLKKPFYRVTIDYGTKKINSLVEICRLKMLQLFKLDEFKRQIENLVSIRVEQIDDFR